MIRAPRLLLLLAVLLALFVPDALVDASEKHGSYVENQRWGYKVRVPRNWKQRAIQLAEPWIADKFFPDYALRTRGVLDTFVEHKPTLWVIGFPKERTERRGVHRRKVDEHTTLITIRNPYKDYQDFVRRESWATTGQGGWYYEREDEIEHAGVPVSVYEIKVEKLVVAPTRIVTWVYHHDDVDFAVQIRILEDHYAENKNVIDGCMKSFREIPRTEPFPQATDAEPDASTETSKKTHAEIYAERVERIEKRIEREAKHLPKGWSVQRTKHFVCLTQIDKQRTRYVLNYAEALHAYLEKHFATLGEARVPPGVIRVFASGEDEAAYTQGTRSWWTDEVGEITMDWGRGSAILSEFSWLARRLTDQYFHIKNENLRSSMPDWIRAGIWGHIAWARPSKRKKFVLAPTPMDARELIVMIRQDKQMPLRDLMTTDAGAYGGYGHIAQARSLVYYLLNRGNKGKLKGSITRYLASLDDIIKEEDKRFEEEEEARWKERAAEMSTDAASDAGKTDEELEAEEEERFRERRRKRSQFNDGLKSKFQAIRERALAEAFGSLNDKDWATLEKRWKKFALNP